MDNSKIIDGKKIASEIRLVVKQLGEKFIDSTGITPGLAVVLVGENPASNVYVRNKIKQTKEVGFNSIEHRLPENISETKLLQLIDELNNDFKVNGILVQLPLPLIKYLIRSFQLRMLMDFMLPMLENYGVD